mmetsp:Transcript_45434/g.119339  ORF Transcript_45434/g.119339 Transcript_45434/m.119339 type:complete len:109 (+) Transcript_45434:404-730(+)
MGKRKYGYWQLSSWNQMLGSSSMPSLALKCLDMSSTLPEGIGLAAHLSQQITSPYQERKQVTWLKQASLSQWSLWTPWSKNIMWTASAYLVLIRRVMMVLFYVELHRF